MPVGDFDGVLAVTAADAGYFGLLRDLMDSLDGAGLPLGIFDVGLTPDQRGWLEARGCTLVIPGWDVDFPGRDRMPSHYRSLASRPHVPRHFPGYDIYLWLDSDLWVQDQAVLRWYVDAARRGNLAIVPELDRSYWTVRKPPKLWGQNQKAFAWSYGVRAGYRLGRNPILNGGAWALRADAPHWDAWARAYDEALNRRAWWRRPSGPQNFYMCLSEQTALNKVVYGDRLPTTFLPALANWFCGKGAPWWDAERRVLVEPNAPYTPLGIVHLAGAGMKTRVWDLTVLQGGTLTTVLSRSAVRENSGLTARPGAESVGLEPVG